MATGSWRTYGFMSNVELRQNIGRGRRASFNIFVHPLTRSYPSEHPRVSPKQGHRVPPHHHAVEHVDVRNRSTSSLSFFLHARFTTSPNRRRFENVICASRFLLHMLATVLLVLMFPHLCSPFPFGQAWRCARQLHLSFVVIS